MTTTNGATRRFFSRAFRGRVWRVVNFLVTFRILFAPSAIYAEPVWKGLSPRGLGRRQAVAFEVTGSDLKAQALHVRDDHLSIKTLGDNKFEITADEETRLGAHLVWLETNEGLHGPQWIHVDAADQVSKSKPGDTADAAMDLSIPCVVDAEFERAADVDWMRFQVDATTFLTIAVQSVSLGSDALLSMTLVDATGREVAHSNDRSQEPVIHVDLPRGEYLLRVVERAYTKPAASFYRIQFYTEEVIDSVFPPVHPSSSDQPIMIYRHRQDSAHSGLFGTTIRTLADFNQQFSDTPVVGGAFAAWPRGQAALVDGANGGAKYSRGGAALESQDGNDTQANAQAVQLPVWLCGQLERRNDRDWFRFTTKKDEAFVIETTGERWGQLMDLEVGIHDASGKLLTTLSDTTQPKGVPAAWGHVALDASGEWKAPADGEYFLVVRDLHGGSLYGPERVYELRVRQAEPVVTVACLLSSKTSPAGLWARVGSEVMAPLFAYRQHGASDKVEVSANSLPEGVQWEAGVIGEKASKQEAICKIGPGAKPGFYTLDLTCGPTEDGSDRSFQPLLLPVKLRVAVQPTTTLLPYIPLVIAPGE